MFCSSARAEGHGNVPDHARDAVAEANANANASAKSRQTTPAVEDRSRGRASETKRAGGNLQSEAGLVRRAAVLGSKANDRRRASVQGDDAVSGEQELL